jgi:hypothetical protein
LVIMHGRMPRARLRTTCGTVLAAALLAGCGPHEPPTVHDRDAILRFKLDEFRIRPQNVTVQATSLPMHLHVVARNVGKLTHNLVIQSSEDPEEAQGVGDEPIVFMKTPTAHAGDTVTGDAYLQPGTYRLTCTIGNHDNLGQYGRLVVLAPKQ